jgi:hypothetical protein
MECSIFSESKSTAHWGGATRTTQNTNPLNKEVVFSLAIGSEFFPLILSGGGLILYAGGVSASGTSSPAFQDLIAHHGETNVGALGHCKAIERAASLDETELERS